MKLSLNWIKEYVDVEMSAGAVGNLLTMLGLEVEGITTVGSGLDDIRVGRIVSVRPHPTAERLTVCTVDAGRQEVEVVCGASNAVAGVSAPLVLPGGRLPDGTRIEEAQIYGVRSSGMLLAEDEMGLTDDHSGILILDGDPTPGDSIAGILGFPDQVLEIAITPNRPDCANVIGIAREIAAATGNPLRRPGIQVEEGGPEIHRLTDVTILDPEGCPRYAAGLIQGVQVGRSPFWMRYRLHQAEIRSISNLVDVTNYVMLEMGQPLHAFDFDRLKEKRIVVRRARGGEAFTTLDGQTRTLSREHLMICDGEGPVALAGIMGGLNSEISPDTQNVLIESAFFDPVTIRRGSKRLGLSTEASYRFERGADIGGVLAALKRALVLMQRWSGGTIARGLIDNYPRPWEAPRILLRTARLNRTLGISLGRSEIRGLLNRLEMDVSSVGDQDLSVRPPSFRVDILREVDLIEEVARCHGFEKIPVTYPRVRPSDEGDPPDFLLHQKVQSIMTGLGFTEIISYSFISPDSADILGAEADSPLRSFVVLRNPLTVDQSVLRTSLIPGLMAAVKTNMAHDPKGGLRLFEWGKTFLRQGQNALPTETIALAGLMTGRFQEKAWYQDERDCDYFDIKGTVEALASGIGLKDISFRPERGVPGYDRQAAAGVYASGTVVGRVGKASPSLTRAYDLRDQEAYLFELDMGEVLKLLSSTIVFRPLPRYPAVYRDISLLVDRRIECATLIEIIRREGGDLLESVSLFDLYQGGNLGPSEKAMAFRLSYRSAEETLDGERVNRLHWAILDKIKAETGGRLREG